MAEAQRVGCDLAMACVMLILESSGGRNVFGRDATKCADEQLGYFKGGQVTQASYEAYKAKRAMCGYNGVGPAQLTFYVWQDRADEMGGCWRPELNVRVGFGLLADYTAAAGQLAAFGLYNGGPQWRKNPAAVGYAIKAMELLPAWQAIVSGHPVSR